MGYDKVIEYLKTTYPGKGLVFHTNPENGEVLDIECIDDPSLIIDPGELNAAIKIA